MHSGAAELALPKIRDILDEEVRVDTHVAIARRIFR